MYVHHGPNIFRLVGGIWRTGLPGVSGRQKAVKRPDGIGGEEHLQAMKILAQDSSFFGEDLSKPNNFCILES